LRHRLFKPSTGFSGSALAFSLAGGRLSPILRFLAGFTVSSKQFHVAGLNLRRFLNDLIFFICNERVDFIFWHCPAVFSRACEIDMFGFIGIPYYSLGMFL